MAEQELLYVNGPPAEINARELRQSLEKPLGEGVRGYADMLVTVGAGDTVDVAAGEGWVRGDAVATPPQGLYRVYNDAAKNSAAFTLGGIGARDAVNPRVDRIVAQVQDTDEGDGTGQRRWLLRVVAGAATAAATLDNLNGVAAVPASAMHLYDVLVPQTGGGAITVRDRRPFAFAVAPPLLTDVDMVPLVPVAPLNRYDAYSPGPARVITASHDLHQVAICCYLRRRIVGATKIRWRYAQHGVAPVTGNYVLALFDASGRKIVDTGAVAWAGAAGTFQTRSETITATTVEAGPIYAFLGVDTSGGTEVYFNGTSLRFPAAVGGPGAPIPNIALRASSGGVTVPTTLLGLTDIGGLSAATDIPAIPDLALSVG